MEQVRIKNWFLAKNADKWESKSLTTEVGETEYESCEHYPEYQDTMRASFYEEPEFS